MLGSIRFSGPVAGAVGQDAIESLAGEVAGTARSMIVAVARPAPLEIGTFKIGFPEVYPDHPRR